MECQNQITRCVLGVALQDYWPLERLDPNNSV